MNLPRKKPGVLKRYGLALALAGLALLIRAALPVPVGTTIYQLPLAAVVLSSWFGGRGPGLLASLICATGLLYWFIPPLNSFDISADYRLAFAIFIGLCLLLTESGEALWRVTRALEQSEGRFRLMAETVPEMLWFQSVAPPIMLYVSPRYEEIWGRPVGDLESGASAWLEAVHPEDRDGVRSAYERWLSGEGANRLEVTFRIVRPDGETRWIHSRATLIRDEQGKPYRGSGISEDITKEKRAQEALENAQTELRARQEMLELAQKAARAVAFDWYIGARERQNRWSPELEAIYGLEPGTFDRTFEGWKKLIHPDDWPAVKLAIKRAHESGDVAAEYRVVYKDGAAHWLRAKGRMFFDAEGRPQRMVGFMSDITDWRHAQEELRASEERFRTFVDRATDAFFLLDEQSLVVDVNRQACESLGWSREELIGMHPRQFDVGLDEPSIGQLAQRAAAGEILTFETRHRRKDGAAFPVEIRSGSFRQGGKLFYLALARDISERKRAEEELRATEARFRTLVESAADGFMLHAGDATVIDVNRQACENLGYSREELIGMKPADFDAALDSEALQRVSERIGAGDIVTVETRHRRKDGTLFPVELRLRQVLQGGQRYTISLARDITERKHVEEERERLRQLEAELARVSRLTTLGELTTSIAHEVGQPLGAMVASAGACACWLAADPPAMVEAQAALDNIVADGKRAREVIARIRALAKRQGPHKDWLDINHEIVEVLALTEHELRGHDIVLRTDLRTTLPRVAGDRVQLQQVLLNLIVNAVEAMSAVHDRSRELAIVSQLEDPDAVLVEVRDSGSGLDPQAADQVFEAFYTTKTEGIGIGLSISRSIIEAHGGRLWASANSPHGAVFRFSLPVTEKVVA